MTRPLGLTEEQLALRRQHVTASEAAAILGLSPYAQGMHVWRTKQPDYQPSPMTPAQEWGHRLEHVVLTRYLDDRREHTLSIPGTLVHDDLIMAATPDAIVACWGAPPHVVQVKTAASREGWGQPGTAEVPVPYWVQVQIEMYVTGLQVAHIPLFVFATRDYSEYVVPRDEDWLRRNIPRLHEWWEQHVYQGIPPAIDLEHGTAMDLLRETYPEHDDDIAMLMGDDLAQADDLMARYRGAQALAQEAEEHLERSKAALCSMIADRQGVQGSSHVARWKATRGSTRVQWQEYAQHLEQMLQVRQVTDLDGVRASYTSHSPGSRRFTLTEVRR
jgi:putative phage-type endonuclease